MRPIAVFRLLAALFGLFLLGVILLADRGLVGRYFGFLYNYPYGDAVGHFLLLGTFSLLLALAFPNTRVPIERAHLLKTSLILAALITLEEFSQLFFPSRSFSLVDLSANYAGILLLGEAGAWLKHARGGKFHPQT